jgi:hypothetical protein
MITGVFAFVGAMVGAVFINYVLHEPNHRIEEHYRNSGHDGSED